MLRNSFVNIKCEFLVYEHFHFVFLCYYLIAIFSAVDGWLWGRGGIGGGENGVDDRIQTTNNLSREAFSIYKNISTRSAITPSLNVFYFVWRIL